MGVMPAARLGICRSHAVRIDSRARDSDPAVSESNNRTPTIPTLRRSANIYSEQTFGPINL